MNVQRYMRIIPGIMIMVSVILGTYHSKWWFAFTFFIGANLTQWGITNFCPLEKILKGIGIKEQ